MSHKNSEQGAFEESYHVKAEGIIVCKICFGADEGQQPLLRERNVKQSLWDGPASTARLLAQLPSCLCG